MIGSLWIVVSIEVIMTIDDNDDNNSDDGDDSDDGDHHLCTPYHPLAHVCL